MESKTKHRILGIVVVAGLAVLAYPFIQGYSGLSGDQVSVKAPPFPDQAIQVTTADDVISSSPIDTLADASSAPEEAPAPYAPKVDANAPAAQPSTAEPDTTPSPYATPKTDNQPAGNANPPAASVPSGNDGVPSTDQSANESKSTADQPASDSKSANDQAPSSDAANADPNAATTPDESNNKPSMNDQNTVNSPHILNDAKPLPPTKPFSPPISNEPESQAPLQSGTVKAAPISSPTSMNADHRHTSKLAKAKPVRVQPVLLSKLSSKSAILANKRQPISNNGLLQLKKAAYVIQLGSFKDKANALRLVNKLRAQGYRAFIQHAVVASGENTRVFVGPEQHQASARVVASELQNKMKLHGIVISYKPFTL